MNAAARDSLRMREMLALNGITLDGAPASISSTAPRAIAAPVDRDLIREILITAGAPDRDLEWLSRSCPSLAAALTYQPPRCL